MEEGIIKKLITSMKCSACGQCYEVGNIEILGHHEDLWFLSVFCPSCRNQYLVAAVVSAQERAPEIITDLTEADLVRLRDTGRLTADEVLDMHGFLKEFDGDFSQLFGGE